MEIEYKEKIVRAFKSYVTKIIQHSSIDYVIKINNKKYTEIAFTEAIDITVSLLNYNEALFLILIV